MVEAGTAFREVEVRWPTVIQCRWQSLSVPQSAEPSWHGYCPMHLGFFDYSVALLEGDWKRRCLPSRESLRQLVLVAVAPAGPVVDVPI